MAVTADSGIRGARPARTLPIHRTLPRLARNPLTAFEEIARESNGDIVRLGLGLFRPYLLTRPEHIQHVLRGRPERYARDGMLWKPLRRLYGEDGIGSVGPGWKASRQLMQPLFAAKNINSLLDRMSAAIVGAVDTLAERAGGGDPFDVSIEMTRIVHRSLSTAFFADGISVDVAHRLGCAVDDAFASLGARMLLPFVPDSVPLPGDRAFRRTVRIADEYMYPLIRARRAAGGDGTDIVSLLCQARDEAGNELTDQQIRNDVVPLFVGGTETTALALTWLWVLLDSHPAVAEKLSAEVRAVVGTAQPTREHLAGLRYTKQVLQEVLRLYPGGWVVPRLVTSDDEIDGVPIKAGSTVLMSPYLTHRLPELWDEPDEFRPERFAPELAAGRHRFAYYPFGGGAHTCLGSHFFTVEAQLAVAALLSRFTVELTNTGPIVPRAMATLKPRQQVNAILRPVGGV